MKPIESLELVSVTGGQGYTWTGVPVGSINSTPSRTWNELAAEQTRRAAQPGYVPPQQYNSIGQPM
jgi:hypothetical protein